MVVGAVIKAVGAWTLEVLVPFGDRARKDSHGEWFDVLTDFAAKYYELPPVVYYHGYDEQGRPMSMPEYLGKSISRTVKADGIWYLVELEPNKPRSGTLMKAAREKKAAASPGSIEHLIRREPSGRLAHWPIVELSIFDTYSGQRPANSYAVAIPAMKAIYTQAGLALPIDIDRQATPPATGEQQRAAQANGQTTSIKTTMEDRSMNEEELARINAAVKAALDARDEEAKVAQERAAAIEVEVAARTAAIKAEMEAAAAASNRLPFGGGAPHVKQFGDTDKFDNLDLGDQAVLVGVLANAAKSGRGTAPSEGAMKALIIKASEDSTWVGERTRSALKAAGFKGDVKAIKADELNRTDLTSYGAEWVSDAWSNVLWEKIRLDAKIVAKIPTVEIPQGADSLTIPLEGTAPTFYKVAQTADLNATTGRPNASVPSSKLGTDNETITASKMGARVVWAGEMDEDSLRPWAAELRAQLQAEGTEVLEHAVIDGDTTLTASTNINDIANVGAQTATNVYLLFNGFRKLALVTNTANSRDGGVLALADYLETLKLMGIAGINALDRTKVGFIIDPSVYYKSLELTQVLTRDVYASPTIENGQLSGLFGVELLPSANITRASATRLSNAAGKVDQTVPGNNTKGSILSVRWDQWRMAFKRRMTMEVTRYPESDANQIVFLMRVGLLPRDTEASAISYNLTV